MNKYVYYFYLFIYSYSYIHFFEYQKRLLNDDFHNDFTNSFLTKLKLNN